MVRRLLHDGGNHYRLHSKARNFLGSISETSHFQHIEHHYIPTRYQYLRKVLGRKSDQVLKFDWTNLKAHYSRSDKPEKNAVYEIFAGLLDPSLYQLKLQQELVHGKTKFYFDFAKDSRLKVLEFTITGEAVYTLNRKEYDAVVVERINQPDTRKTKILLIPEFNYQIASIDHLEKDGSTYKIRLSGFSRDKELLEAFYTERAQAHL